MTCLPVTWAHPGPLVPPVSIMLQSTFQLSFFTQKDWRLKTSAQLCKEHFRSREHNALILILSNSGAENTFPLIFLLLFTKLISIPPIGNTRAASRGRVQTPCLSKEQIIRSVTTALCERSVTSHAGMQPQLALAVGDQKLEDNLLQHHDPWHCSELQQGAGSCTWPRTLQKARQPCTSDSAISYN